MTYCLAITVDAGLVMASDSRTNAGVDQISTYSKMFHFGIPGQRRFVLLSAGNLATTQAVVNQLRYEMTDAAAIPSLAGVAHLFEAADYIGSLSVQVQQRNNDAVRACGFSPEATFLLGGQIGSEPHGIYLIYPQGNYITASPYEPYLQIGETKYGKPILDRIVHCGLSLDDAARCALVSLDSTMRSNVSVGPPLELLIYPRDSHGPGRHVRFDPEDPVYARFKHSWGQGIKEAFGRLPRFDWE